MRKRLLASGCPDDDYVDGVCYQETLAADLSAIKIFKFLTNRNYVTEDQL